MGPHTFVVQMTGLDDRDIVFIRYVGQAKDRNCLPYFIAVDESTKSVGQSSPPPTPHPTYCPTPSSNERYSRTHLMLGGLGI